MLSLSAIQVHEEGQKERYEILTWLNKYIPRAKITWVHVFQMTEDNDVTQLSHYVPAEYHLVLLVVVPSRHSNSD